MMVEGDVQRTTGPGEGGHARLTEMAGGWRGIVEGGLPSIAFVTTNVVVTGTSGPGRGLHVALAVAATAAVVVAAAALAQQRPLRQAAAGVVGLSFAAGYAAWADEARAFFLPGIWVDAAYAVALALSVVAGRPLLGYVHRWLFGGRDQWWSDPHVRMPLALVTFGWAAVYGLRASTQTVLYAADRPTLLAVAKLALGWPLTVAAIAASVAYLRHRGVHSRRGNLQA